MKVRFILIPMMSTLLIIDACSQKMISKNDNKKFEYHFTIMDSIAAITPNDTLVNVLESIAFMERKTGIEASTDGTLVGRLACTKKDLARWHEWYRQRSGKKGKKSRS